MGRAPPHPGASFILPRTRRDRAAQPRVPVHRQHRRRVPVPVHRSPRGEGWHCLSVRHPWLFLSSFPSSASPSPPRLACPRLTAGQSARLPFGRQFSPNRDFFFAGTGWHPRAPAGVYTGCSGPGRGGKAVWAPPWPREPPKINPDPAARLPSLIDIFSPLTSHPRGRGEKALFFLLF